MAMEFISTDDQKILKTQIIQPEKRAGAEFALAGIKEERGDLVSVALVQTTAFRRI